MVTIVVEQSCTIDRVCRQTRVVVIPLYISDYCERCFPTNKNPSQVKVKFDTHLLKIVVRQE